MDDEIKKQRYEARDLIKKKKFEQAKILIDHIVEMAPHDVKGLEVLDFWYHATSTLDDATKLRGQLDTINRMLTIHPSGTLDVFEEADYFPDLHETRVGIMGTLSLETLDLNLLKETMIAYDNLFEAKGLDDDLVEDRNSMFDLVANRVTTEDIEKVFGDVTKLRARFEEGRKMSED